MMFMILCNDSQGRPDPHIQQQPVAVYEVIEPGVLPSFPISIIFNNHSFLV